MHDHPSYNDALRAAAEHAYRDKGYSFIVYYDGKAMFVRAADTSAPPAAKVVCVAQHWSDSTVQLRFAGAESQWINF
jgi:hypothetical protein